MGQIVVNVGSFDLTSHNGNTAYSTTKYFNIPANAGITGCVATFVTHVNTGNFQGKSFSLNGAQAHPNTPWPTSGIALNAALLSTGQNTFRAAVKSQAGLSARWSIGDIYLTIDYTDYGGGEVGPPVSGGGPVVVTPSAIDAGAGSVTVTCPAETGIWHWIDWTFGDYSGSWSHPWEAGGTNSINIPIEWASQLPNSTQGTLAIRVRRSTTPAEPYSFATDQTINVTIRVPASAVPTIGTFTASLNANGVDASITKYVQNYSKSDLEIVGAAGALDSTIAAYEITGGGWNANADIATFGPFPQAGDITFIAKVTDTRGRTATKSVTINVLSYGPPAFSNPEAWRSSDAGVKNQKGTYAMLKSGVSYSSLGGENSVTLKGRVYPKGGTVPAYTSMTPDTAWITGGGLLLVTKTYIAQMLVEDLISARIIEFTIPTKKTGISIMTGMQGIAFGKSAEIPGYAEFGWPIYNCPYEVGDILQTLNTSSPEDRWPGTEWEAIPGRALVGFDDTQTEFDTAGEEGGSKTVQLGLESGYAKVSPGNFSGDTFITYNAKTGVSWSTDREVKVPAGVDQTTSQAKTTGISLGGTTDSGSNLQPYKVVYMWLRTA